MEHMAESHDKKGKHMAKRKHDYLQNNHKNRDMKTRS